MNKYFYFIKCNTVYKTNIIHFINILIGIIVIFMYFYILIHVRINNKHRKSNYQYIHFDSIKFVIKTENPSSVIPVRKYDIEFNLKFYKLSMECYNHRKFRFRFAKNVFG